MTQGHADRGGPVRLESEPTAPDPCFQSDTVTRQAFVAGFDRCFGRVYAYVARRVDDRETCERIVRAVLTENLDLLVRRAGDELESGRLKALSDRLIGVETDRTSEAVSGQVTKIDLERSRVAVRDSCGKPYEFEASTETLKDLRVGDHLEAKRRSE